MIADQDYLRRYMTGVLHLTLVEPRADYVPGQKIGWASRRRAPGGQGGRAPAPGRTRASSPGTDIFEVFEYRPYGGGQRGHPDRPLPAVEPVAPDDVPTRDNPDLT
jgi:hypothetical protein